VSFSRTGREIQLIISVISGPADPGFQQAESTGNQSGDWKLLLIAKSLHSPRNISSSLQFKDEDKDEDEDLKTGRRESARARTYIEEMQIGAGLVVKENCHAGVSDRSVKIAHRLFLL